MHCKYDGRVLLYLLPSLVGLDQLSLARSITAKTLLVYDREDIEPIEQAHLLHAIIEESKILMIDECAQLPWIDQPEIFGTALQYFLCP